MHGFRLDLHHAERVQLAIAADGGEMSEATQTEEEQREIELRTQTAPSRIAGQQPPIIRHHRFWLR